jgi:phosphopantothenoylcysteine synthetase/decarboxylase
MSLAAKHVLVTSGPTRADLDAVRYISNRSSGRLGCIMALEALARGAQVTMVAGHGSAVPGPGDAEETVLERLRVLRIETVGDLVKALEAELRPHPRPDALVHAMAVLDYVPEAAREDKTPSGRESWEIRLVKTPKVIRMIRDWAPETCLVQFKLEVGLDDEALRDAATASMRVNRADLVVANDLARIRDDVHPALIIGSEGEILARPATKSEIARQLCDVLGRILGSG